jgi:hypothetical protein
MYFIPIALLIKGGAPASFWAAAGASPGQFANLTWSSFFVSNLLPVTIGNIVGGALLVGAMYWCIYLRPRLTASVVPLPHHEQAPLGDGSMSPSRGAEDRQKKIHV